VLVALGSSAAEHEELACQIARLFRDDMAMVTADAAAFCTRDALRQVGAGAFVADIELPVFAS
jgi:hypothetical protein